MVIRRGESGRAVGVGAEGGVPSRPVPSRPIPVLFRFDGTLFCDRLPVA